MNKFKPNKGKTFVSLPEYARVREFERKDGTTTIGGDYYPVVLRAKRDPEVWKRDPNVKEARKQLNSSMRGSVYLIEQLTSCLHKMKYDLHIKFGKQKL